MTGNVETNQKPIRIYNDYIDVLENIRNVEVLTIDSGKLTSNTELTIAFTADDPKEYGNTHRYLLESQKALALLTLYQYKSETDENPAYVGGLAKLFKAYGSNPAERFVKLAQDLQDTCETQFEISSQMALLFKGAKIVNVEIDESAQLHQILAKIHEAIHQSLAFYFTQCSEKTKEEVQE